MNGVTVPGWDISEDDGLFIAVRQGELSKYQVMYGALAELEARDEGELWMLCDAQTRLAERLGTAEVTARTAMFRRAAAARS